MLKPFSGTSCPRQNACRPYGLRNLLLKTCADSFTVFGRYGGESFFC